MKIHSDVITPQDIEQAVPEGCHLAFFHNLDGKLVLIDRVGSRSHDCAYVVRLSGSSPACLRSLPDKAATYDEWGFFIAALYERDPEARIGNYKNERDFEHKTEGAYVTTQARARGFRKYV